MSTIEERLAALESDARITRLTAKVDQLDAKVDQRFDELRVTMTERFDQTGLLLEQIIRRLPAE